MLFVRRAQGGAFAVLRLLAYRPQLGRMCSAATAAKQASLLVCPPAHCVLQVTDMIAEGYPAQQVLLQLQALLVPGAVTGAAAAPDDDTAALSDTQRAKMCELLAAADKDLVDGADEFLQLLNVAGGMQAQIMA